MLFFWAQFCFFNSITKSLLSRKFIHPVPGKDTPYLKVIVELNISFDEKSRSGYSILK